MQTGLPEPAPSQDAPAAPADGRRAGGGRGLRRGLLPEGQFQLSRSESMLRCSYGSEKPLSVSGENLGAQIPRSRAALRARHHRRSGGHPDRPQPQDGGCNLHAAAAAHGASGRGRLSVPGPGRDRRELFRPLPPARPARSRCGEEDAGLRHSGTRRSRPLPDREKLFENNASGHHRGPRRTLCRDHHRRLPQLRRAGRSGLLAASPDQQIPRQDPPGLCREREPISTVSRASGATPSAATRSSTACVGPAFRCFSRRPSSVSTHAIRISTRSSSDRAE